jgi:hypothetical protein
MLGWVGDIEQATLDNTTFRTVLVTGEHEQLTVMRLQPASRARVRGAAAGGGNRTRGNPEHVEAASPG